MSWIKTSERIPELTHKLYDCCGYEFWMSDPVILVYEGATAIGAYAGEDGWCLLNGDQRYTSGEVTHWMPLPEPPKEDEHE